MVDPRDIAAVGEQLGRAPRTFVRVVARCSSGRPVVVEQPAYDEHGHPFPTSFWLTCPSLVAAIGRLESAGGIAAMERAIEDDPALASSFAAARARQVAMRPERGDLGVGGVRDPRRVKCLHAHLAFALGSPPYELGERVLREVGGIPARCCMDD